MSKAAGGGSVVGMEFADVETARSAKGLRLVVLAGVPSPWSQAAKAIIELKQIEAVAVRMQLGDEAVRSWTGVHNAPVALYANEPPRAVWADILALAERLQPDPPLVPEQARTRALMYGLSHELMGEGGVLWCSRLFTLEAAFASDGKQGFPIPVARHLAARYGYAPGCGAPARARLVQGLAALAEQLQCSRAAGHPYYLGERPTALDIYSATSLNALDPLPADQCAMHPVARAAFDWVRAQLNDALPQALREHRALMYERHLALPLQL